MHFQLHQIFVMQMIGPIQPQPRPWRPLTTTFSVFADVCPLRRLRAAGVAFGAVNPVITSSSAACSRVRTLVVPSPDCSPSNSSTRSRATLCHRCCRLTLPGLRNQDTADRVCRSFKICHNSKGTAWTTVQLFSALEPLLHQLKLEPATEYVEVQPLTGCLTSGCCCSTPVEVRFSLPVHRDRQTAADELAAVSEFLQFRLPREMKDTACTAAVLGGCPPALAAERKLLR